MIFQIIPKRRSIANPPFFYGLIRQSALFKIIGRLTCPRKILLKKLVDSSITAKSFSLSSLNFGFSGTSSTPRPFRENFESAPKIQPLKFFHESENVPFRPAPETIIGIALR